MTVSSLSGLSRGAAWLLVGAVAALPLHGALAQQTRQQTSQPAKPKPAPVYVPPPPAARFNAATRQQQVRDQLQKNQLEEQLRQGSMDTLKRPTANDPTHTDQLDQASRAQNQRYRSRQQDLIDRYQDAATPPPPTRASQPASSRSGG